MSMDSESGNRFRGSDMRPERKSKDRPEAELDRELLDLPPELRWREWMRRIEAVLFASASPVPREDLARNIERRPGLWSRYAGFLDTLPSRGD